MSVSYKVNRRTANCFAVVRTGPRGGTKVVEVYDNELTANAVCGVLNRAAVSVR